VSGEHDVADRERGTGREADPEAGREQQPARPAAHPGAADRGDAQAEHR
jgi:hypothetical protein